MSRTPSAPASLSAADPNADTPHDDAHHDSAPALRRSLVWGLTAGSSSMVVHLALLLVLGLIVDRVVPPKVIICFDSPSEPQREQFELTEKLKMPDEPSLTSGSSIPNCWARSPSNQSFADFDNAMREPKLKCATTARSTDMKVDPGVANVFAGMSRELVAPVPEGFMGTQEGAQTYEAAMDRITQEILNKLARRKVLLVWIFDQSDSMTDDRDEITLRIERVYQELGLTAVSRNNALLTAVTSYGAAFATQTPQPTSNPDEIIAAIKAVPIDPSGEEKMCRAVTSSIGQYQRLAEQQDRQLMCVLVTDESGDMNSNFTDLEQTITTARAARSPIYVLGREAVFGYPYAHIRWTDPETKHQAWIRIDRGPESPYPEQLQVDGFHRRFDAHPSGFGPYEQSRMARETGGVFFMLPSPEANLVGRDERNYDPDTMRAYLPDLSSREAYAQERDKYPMRAMLWKVITDLNPYDTRLAQIVQVRLHDWPLEREAYAREADAQVKKAQNLIQYFAQAQRGLETMAKHRDRDPSVRWRANYDLTHAQTIAYQARLHEYVAYVGAFVKNPKAVKNVLGPSRPTNEWNAALVKRTLVDDEQVTALRDRATELYRRLAKEHPGTPWAARAELELARPYGLEFHEGYEAPRSMVPIRIPKK